ncbi:Uma2 family endonuclease [candidate division KSB1 bacterium]|nr:Uma2 family endonuclease [candidate division KSB1 bacterium]
MGLPVKKLGNGFTYGDYITWPDEERWEVIDGDAYDMSPAPSRRHQQISRELGTQIKVFLDDKPCELYYAPFDVRLPEANQIDEEIRTIVQPDIVVICDEKKLDDKGARGAPDLIIEILSPSTSAKDMKIKLPLYERHGVKEYWIVHPTDNTVMVFKLDKRKTYGKPDVYTEEDKIKTPILEGLEVDLELVFKE